MRYEHGRYITNLVPHTTQVSNAVSPRVYDIKLLSSHHRNARARRVGRRQRTTGTTERDMQAVFHCGENVAAYSGVHTASHQCLKYGGTLRISHCHDD